jgi:digeranylgeranylglycerophospholipid reductase
MMIGLRPELCAYCGGCVSLCPTGALELAETRLLVSEERCSGCALCVAGCPTGALYKPGEGSPDILARRKYDLVVVGAGPAGSTAARVAAELGLAVLLVEKRQEIGSPVRCAEGINEEMLLSFIEPQESWIAARVNKAQVTSVSTGESRSYAAQDVGYVLERRVFDRALAEKAVAAGAKVMVKTTVERLMTERGAVKGVVAKNGKNRFEIEAPLVIGADGVESRIGRWAGLDTTLRSEDCLACAQFTLAGVDIDPECCYYFLGAELAPGGYAWVFPKGQDRANVGVGVQADLAVLPALEYLHRFISQQPWLEQGSPVTLVAGNVPVGVPAVDFVADGVMLAGDAARQADPLTGGGIANAMLAGQAAGETAAQAADRGLSSKGCLQHYEQLWAEARGAKMERNYRLKKRFSAEERSSPSFFRAFAVAAAGK